jgi:hypothetical protein
VQYCGRSTPFVGCIANKSKRCLQVLLDLRADTSTPRGTQTPLEYARSLKCDEITQMLIDAGI